MADACVTTVKVPGIADRRVVVDANGDAALDEMPGAVEKLFFQLFGLKPDQVNPTRRIVIPREMRNEIADALRVSEDE